MEEEEEAAAAAVEALVLEAGKGKAAGSRI
jgi:hypothetical protein